MSLFVRFGVLLIAMGALLMLPLRSTEAATTQIQVGDFWFCNSTYANGTCPTSIALGDTVQWNFPTTNYHSSTWTSGGSGFTWDSGLHFGGTYSVQFTQAGTFNYHCSVHLGQMMGQINVLAGVGGIAGLPDAANDPLTQPQSSSNHVALIAGAAAIALGVLVLGGASLYAVRRRID